MQQGAVPSFGRYGNICVSMYAIYVIYVLCICEINVIYGMLHVLYMLHVLCFIYPFRLLVIPYTCRKILTCSPLHHVEIEVYPD